MTYGDKIKKLRKDSNMTMEEYCKFAHMSKPTLCRLENNKYTKKVPRQLLIKIANIHNMPLDYFLTQDFDHIPSYAMDFVKNPESKQYIMKAYYSFMMDRAK